MKRSACAYGRAIYDKAKEKAIRLCKGHADIMTGHLRIPICVVEGTPAQSRRNCASCILSGSAKSSAKLAFALTAPESDWPNVHAPSLGPHRISTLPALPAEAGLLQSGHCALSFFMPHHSNILALGRLDFSYICHSGIKLQACQSAWRARPSYTCICVYTYIIFVFNVLLLMEIIKVCISVKNIRSI